MICLFSKSFDIIQFVMSPYFDVKPCTSKPLWSWILVHTNCRPINYRNGVTTLITYHVNLFVYLQPIIRNLVHISPCTNQGSNLLVTAVSTMLHRQTPLSLSLTPTHFLLLWRFELTWSLTWAPNYARQVDCSLFMFLIRRAKHRFHFYIT